MPLGIEKKISRIQDSATSRVQSIRERVATRINQNRAFIYYGVLPSLVMWPVILGIQAADNAWSEPGRRVAAETKSAQKEAERLAKEEDFKQTAGANFLRGESNSMAVTLRESSSLAGSRIDLLNGVWDRIHRETGCDIGSTTHLEAIPGFLWGQKEPEAYAVTLTNCSPNKVQSAQ